VTASPTSPRNGRGPRAGIPFFRRWLGRSLRRSLAAGAVATASLALSAALVFCLAAVSSGVEAALGKELRAYGANLLVLPRSAPLRFGLGALELGPVEEERRLREDEVLRLGAAVPEVQGVAPALLGRASVRGESVGTIGYPLDRLRAMNPLWRVLPRWPAPDEAMAGATLAARLRLAPGEALVVTAGVRTATVRLAAIVETGGPEDDDLFLPLAPAQALAGAAGEVSLALVRADLASRAPEDVARAIEAALPGAEARTLAQVARAEGALLERVKRLLLLVAVALGGATAFTVSGTLGVLLLARRQEIGLYLALGAGGGRVRGLLLAEAAASGLLGGAAGCVLGAVAAEAIAATVFGAAVPIGVLPPVLAVGTALALALGASAWPVARALRLSPVDTLRAP
jgi:putative ABC transport system permease protein